MAPESNPPVKLNSPVNQRSRESERVAAGWARATVGVAVAPRDSASRPRARREGREAPTPPSRRDFPRPRPLCPNRPDPETTSPPSFREGVGNSTRLRAKCAQTGARLARDRTQTCVRWTFPAHQKPPFWSSTMGSSEHQKCLSIRCSPSSWNSLGRLRCPQEGGSNGRGEMGPHLNQPAQLVGWAPGLTAGNTAGGGRKALVFCQGIRGVHSGSQAECRRFDPGRPLCLPPMSDDDSGGFLLANSRGSASPGDAGGGGRIGADGRPKAGDYLGERALAQARVQAGVQGVGG